MKRLTRIMLVVIILLVIVATVGPFLVPIPVLEGTLPPERLADADSRLIDLVGLRVHAKVAGEGGPVFLLLHGFGASLFSWREVMAPLAEVGTVIAHDRPAFGLTSRPLPGEWTGENPYSADFQVKLDIGLLDSLGVEKAILVGNSAGGTLAVLTALRHPDRVRALVLVDAAIYTSGGTPLWLRPVLRTLQMRHLGPLLVRALIPRMESLGDLAWHDPSKLTPEVWSGYTKPLRAENWDKAFWEFLLASRPLRLDQQLDQIQIPALVITGDDDRIVPTEESIRLARELPNSQLAVIPACGHVPQEEQPAAFLELVVGFAEGLP